MKLQTILFLIDPESLCPPNTPGSDAQAVLLIERLYGRDPRGWSRVSSALYHAEEAHSAALARALADRLWLRPRVLLPPGLPASHWAGALDQLGRQHAGGRVIVVAPQGAIAPAATRLLRLERAVEAPDPLPGVRHFTLDADALTLQDSSRIYMCTSFHARAGR